MFDIGPGELVLVAIIGLLVLGPQRLPKVAAEIGKWVGRARRTATQLRRQLEREIEISEIEKPPAPPSPPPPAPAPTAPRAAPSGEVPPGPGTHVDQPELAESAPESVPEAPERDKSSAPS
jgi:sec-independent protein translocase protein TatB